MSGLRIVRRANVVSGRSGGLRTALRNLGEDYRAAGQDPVLVVPWRGDATERHPWGRVTPPPRPPEPAGTPRDLPHPPPHRVQAWRDLTGGCPTTFDR
ncbi:hypothetical protein [Salinispora arenicola]|uniref:Uncharacterized protein n=1 Tax=Salinispora arenicola TaxID=168697 RepID=A0A542XHC8_SALAC|nr:hypothetical protein [Salinispora arenicola]MCN0154201.1 hypothetical protein [Salinispora arenicola]TQL35219.1 hypothetical protein FB564_0250 [Salinispora arenicola]GIM86353.1 hypothetical protein Sar04_30890 [Salinispora arenicola]